VRRDMRKAILITLFIEYSLIVNIVVIVIMTHMEDMDLEVLGIFEL
jgi:Flp pilus assembly pilin Flp